MILFKQIRPDGTSTTSFKIVIQENNNNKVFPRVVISNILMTFQYSVKHDVTAPINV